MKFAPATARGDAVAVSMVWLVANTTVKGRHDEDMQALRQALRLRTTPAPIAPLPIPAEARRARSRRAPLMKPVVPEAAAGLRRCRRTDSKLLASKLLTTEFVPARSRHSRTHRSRE